MLSLTFLTIISLYFTLISCVDDFSPQTVYRSLQTEKLVLEDEFFELTQTWNIQKSYGSNTIKDTYFSKTETLLVNLQLDNVFHDFTKQDLSITSNSLHMEGDDVFRLEFSFKYTYTYFRTGSGVGTAIVTGKNYTLDKTFSSDMPDRVVPQVKIHFDVGDMTVKLSGAYETDAEVNRLVQVNLSSFLKQSVIKDVCSDLNFEIFLYYIEKYSDVDVRAVTFLPEMHFTFDNTFNRVPQFLENGLIHYRNFDNKDGSQIEGNATWANFTTTDGPYQIFYHQNILNDILVSEYQNNTDRYSFNSSFPSDIPFGLNVSSLAYAYPGKFLI